MTTPADTNDEVTRHFVAALRAVYPERDVAYAIVWAVHDELEIPDKVQPGDLHVSGSIGMAHALLTLGAAKTLLEPDYISTNKPQG